MTKRIFYGIYLNNKIVGRNTLNGIAPCAYNSKKGAEIVRVDMGSKNKKKYTVKKIRI